MTRFVPLGGFLGAGKTTTLIAAAKALEADGARVAIVTNDQGTELIDTQLARRHLGAVAEVTGGCFCCRFDDLMAVTGNLLAGDAADVIIAEAVGSCTDLQATVVRPLRALHGDRFSVAPLTTVVDPVRYGSLPSSLPLLSSEDDMAYLYGHQLAEADIIAVNKGDLLGDASLAGLVSRLRAEYPHATVLPYSARTGRGLPELIEAWRTAPCPSPVVDIDYDRYASAEAGLAWFNRSYMISAPPGFSPGRWSSALLEFVSAATAANRWTVGHAKVSVEVPEGLTKLSLTAAGGAATVDGAVATTARQARASLNARIACDPRDMDRLAAGAVAAADAASGAASTASGGPPLAATAFRPGYPRPVHRMTGKSA